MDLFVTGGENNKTGWGNADYDRLVRDAAAELDPAKRMGMLQAAEAILVDELPVLPIYNYVTQTTFSPRLGGYFPNVKDEHFPKFWYWMDEEELAAKRAGLAGRDDMQAVEAWGPENGLYPPAHPKGRARASDEAPPLDQAPPRDKEGGD
ncbi:MAG: hypothetical protein P8M11_00515 [Planctomycetota bacterium]|nr:hypothetical protein [Planctomycetota bacterium]